MELTSSRNLNGKEKNKMEYPKLNGKIVERFRTVRAFSRAIGKDEGAISRKLNGKAKISLDEVRKWSEILEIPPELIGYYFF